MWWNNDTSEWAYWATYEDAAAAFSAVNCICIEVSVV